MRAFCVPTPSRPLCRVPRRTTSGTIITRLEGHPPRPLLLNALAYVEFHGRALDLGAGPLNDSRYLLSQGFKKVVALEPASAALPPASSMASPSFRTHLPPLRGLRIQR